MWRNLTAKQKLRCRTRTDLNATVDPLAALFLDREWIGRRHQRRPLTHGGRELDLLRPGICIRRPCESQNER